MSELAVGYIRVSTDDQARHSPETQYNHIQNYIDAKEWRFLQKRLRKTDIELDERITDYTIEKDNEKSLEFLLSRVQAGHQKEDQYLKRLLIMFVRIRR